MTHANAPLRVEGRRRLVERCRARPIAHVAAKMGIFRATASKWVARALASRTRTACIRDARRRHGPSGAEGSAAVRCPLDTAPPRVCVTGRPTSSRRLGGPVGGLRYGRSGRLGWRELVLSTTLVEAIRCGLMPHSERDGFPVHLEGPAVRLDPRDQQVREKD
ncbi:leucine zipper domain-containing protein [Micromonospora sp. NPDC005298]|uniref:leucine zipper domain-containing protein n=1 Tax=Micromonospora sp. NPDC005298 TaxID=3156873 RepID=UPI0033BD4B00